MASYGVLIPEQTAAMNTDSLNRSVASTSASALGNGSVFRMDGKVGTSGSGAEVFNIEQPATGSLTNLWMAYSGDEIVVTANKYKGLDPNPQNFFNLKNDVFSAYKPQVGDIILVTGDAVTGSFVAADSNWAKASDSKYQLEWSGQHTSSALCYKRLGVKYISLATGSIDTQRVTAYQLECVQN